MIKTTFILMFITQTGCIKQIRKNEALKFLGYDCNKPSKLNSYKKFIRLTVMKLTHEFLSEKLKEMKHKNCIKFENAF